MTPLLTTEELTKTFNPGRHAEVKAVSGINLSINKGEIILVMGPSGSGKTTLLTMLGALLKPTAGKIIFEGIEIQRLSQAQLTRLRRHKFGFVFQSFNLLENLCAWENVYIAGFGRNNSKQRAIGLLTRLGLAARLHQKPRQLSGGERQRVAIARALVNDPEIIFADEPTANLDSKNGHEVMSLLCEIACQEKKSVVIVSHDERLRDIATRVITIEDGRFTKDEPGDHVKFCPHHDHAQQ